MVRPPAVAEALLALFLPGGGVRESVLGDLHEMFARRAGGPGGSRGRARLWYWATALRLVAGYAMRRATGARYRGFAPPERPAALATGRGGGELMSTIARQIRISARSLWRTPGFTVPSLLILAIGITAATAIFTVVDSIVLRPLDLPESERLVIVCEDHARNAGGCRASPTNVGDFAAGSTVLADLGIARGWPFTLADARGTEGVHGGLASAGFWRAIGVRPHVGRLFRDEEIGSGQDRVAILSHAYWSARFGADEAVIGRTILLSGEPTEIVGVLPQGFDLPFDLAGIEVWKAPHVTLTDESVRQWRGFLAIGRLGQEGSVAAASAELGALYAGIAQRHEAVDDEWRLRVQPLLRVVVGDTRAVLLAFLAASGLLVLIVCANMANLMLARGLGRRQELAVRASLGAGRRRLVGEILVEGLLLSGLAAFVALALSGGTVRLLLALAPPGIPRLDEVAMDARVLAFAAVVAAAATLLFSALPAVSVTSWNLGQLTKGSARGGDHRSSTRLQNALVVAELALSVVLLASAALLTRSFVAYLRWDAGFDREPLLAVSAFFDPGKYPTRADFVPVIRRGEELIRAVPGVAAVATASAGPLFGGGDGATPFVTERADPSGALPTARWFDVGPGYFGTLGLEVVRGRELTEDDAPDAPQVAVVNEAFARLAWAGEDPIGRRVTLPEIGGLDLEIVGVVADVRPMTPGEAPYPEIYWSNRQLGRPATFYLVRASADPASLGRGVVDALETADPDVTHGTPSTLVESAGRALVRPRFQAIVLLTFALAGLVLSVVGVYAVVSYTAARRTREMGIRVALGARAGDVVSEVARSSLLVTAAGIGLGLMGAAAAGRVLRGLIPGVSPADPVSFVGAALVLLCAATAATLVPSRTASRVDPIQAIRAE